MCFSLFEYFIQHSFNIFFCFFFPPFFLSFYLSNFRNANRWNIHGICQQSVRKSEVWHTERRTAWNLNVLFLHRGLATAGLTSVTASITSKWILVMHWARLGIFNKMVFEFNFCFVFFEKKENFDAIAKCSISLETRMNSEYVHTQILSQEFILEMNFPMK